MTATISICIPCYKSERYIRTTIESVLAQTVPATEILISDDRSPDRSFEIVKEYEGFPRVRIMRPPHRTTLGGHYRFLLEQSTSDYVCFLSSDDALMPHFVETMQREVNNEDNIGMVAAACLECNSKLIPTRLRGGGLPKEVFEPPNGFHHFKRGNTYTISVSVLSRKILINTPPIPPQGDLATDWCWSMLLGAKGKIKFVRKPLGYYRIHTTNAGHNNEDAWQKATAEMLVFLKDYFELELGNELEKPLQRIRGQIEKRHRGETEEIAERAFTVRVNDFAKILIAFRYRWLSRTIRKAEKGTSVTLERARGRA